MYFSFLWMIRNQFGIFYKTWFLCISNSLAHSSILAITVVSFSWLKLGLPATITGIKQVIHWRNISQDSTRATISFSAGKITFPSFQFSRSNLSSGKRSTPRSRRVLAFASYANSRFFFHGSWLNFSVEFCGVNMHQCNFSNFCVFALKRADSFQYCFGSFFKRQKF